MVVLKRIVEMKKFTGTTAKFAILSKGILNWQRRIISSGVLNRIEEF